MLDHVTKQCKLFEANPDPIWAKQRDLKTG